MVFLSGCDIQPRNMRKDLDALGGPKTGSVSDSLKGQAEQAEASGNYGHAAQTYKQLADKNPENKDYTLALADSLRRAGNYDDALKVLGKYIDDHPGDAQAHEISGLCQMNLGNFADAGKAFEEVMKVEPTRWRTLNAVGILFSIKGKFPEAQGYYDEALQNSADSAAVLNNKAITLAMENKYDESFDVFMKARKKLKNGSKEQGQIDMNLALVYAIAGRLDDAERTASPYLSKAALYNNMGVYADLAKNPEMAKSYLNMALTQSPTYYERAWKNLNAVSEEKRSSAPKKAPKTITISQPEPTAKEAEVKPEEKPVAETAEEKKEEKAAAKKEAGRKVKAEVPEPEAPALNEPAAGKTEPAEKKLEDIPESQPAATEKLQLKAPVITDEDN